MKYYTIPTDNPYVGRKPKFDDLPVGAIFTMDYRHFAIPHVKFSKTKYADFYYGEFTKKDPYYGKFIKDMPLYWKETLLLK
jgi:hypothetical protein